MTKKRPPSPSINNNNNNNNGVVDVDVGVGGSRSGNNNKNNGNSNSNSNSNKSNTCKRSSFSLAKYCDDRKSDERRNKDDVDNDNDNDDDNISRVYHGICPDVSNRYRKVGDGHRIGHGTYGVVYRARDTWVTTATNGNKNGNMNGNMDNNKNNNNGNGGNGDGTSPSTHQTKNQQRQHQTYQSQSQKNVSLVVALKKCYAHHESSDGFSITTLREINALRVCATHPNIVNLLDIAVSSSSSSSNSGGTSGNKNNDDDEDDDDDDNDKGDAKKRKTRRTTTRTKMKIGNVFLVFEHCQYDIAQILDSYYNYNQKHHNNNNNRNNNNNNNTPYYNNNRSIKSSKRSKSNKSPFTTKQVQILSYQLLSAIEFCHRHCLIHRDIKPSNLLYDTITGQLKLCDFGLSRIVPQSQSGVSASSVGTSTTLCNIPPSPQPMTPNVVSLWYRAPELLLPTNTTSTSTSASNNKSNINQNYYNIQYSFPIDLWSTGCVIAELLQGYPFLDGKSEIDQIQKMIQTIGRLPTNIYQYNQNDSNQNEMSSSYASPHQHQHSQSLWDKFDYLSSDGLTLLTRLLEYDPNERWDVKHALQSNYFINLSTTTTSTTTSTSTNEINNDMMMPKQFHFMD